MVYCILRKSWRADFLFWHLVACWCMKWLYTLVLCHLESFLRQTWYFVWQNSYETDIALLFEKWMQWLDDFSKLGSRWGVWCSVSNALNTRCDASVRLFSTNGLASSTHRWSNVRILHRWIDGGGEREAWLACLQPTHTYRIRHRHQWFRISESFKSNHQTSMMGFIIIYLRRYVQNVYWYSNFNWLTLIVRSRPSYTRVDYCTRTVRARLLLYSLRSLARLARWPANNDDSSDSLTLQHRSHALKQ